MAQGFAAAYQRLNAQQRRAVDTLEGPVMVIAGPGTGKTQVLATRIGQLLKQTDVEPRNILALTFTDAAATTMRQRLAQLIGPAAYSVQIATFHAFCAQVLAEHPESFPLERDSRPLTELEQHEIMSELLQELNLEELRPLNRPLFYLKDCVRAISQLKREYVSPEQLRQMVAAEFAQLEDGTIKLTAAQRRLTDKKLRKQDELALVYAQYQERLRAAHRVDFDDMISFVVAAFREDSLLLQEYQELIQYILVDEYQDTNSAQNEVVSLLGSYWGEQANIFVVGDPHQSIFRFQGASMENMLGFLVRYPQAEVVTLTQGYRCGQTIYQAAHALIGKQSLPVPSALAAKQAQTLVTALTQQLVSQADYQGTVRCAQLPTQTAEQLYIANQIKELVAAEVPLSQIAVLYRTNAEGYELEKVLSAVGIRYQIERGTNALEVPLVSQFVQLCTLLYHLRSVQDEEAFTVLCFEWMKTDRIATFKLIRQAAMSNRTLVNLAQLEWVEFSSEQLAYDPAVQLSEAEFIGIHRIIEQWQGWITLEPGIPFTHWFTLVLEQTELIDWILQQPQSQELLKAIQGLYAVVQAAVAANHQYGLADFVRTITLMQEQGIAVRQEDIRTTAEAVTLSTAHSAKGKEWHYVFLYNCVDSQWGGSRVVEKLALPESILRYSEPSERTAQAEADERRLFYVALTRARRQVTITYPEFVISESKQRQQLASRFLADISEYTDAVAEKVVQEFGEQAESHIPDLLRPTPVPTTSEIKQSEKEFFTYLIDNFALSVSALNHYLADPKLFRDADLLRVPSMKDAYLSYGSAMHRALEFWRRPTITGGKPATEASVIQEFDRALAQEVLTAEEFVRRQKKGRTVLKEYIAYMEKDFAQTFSLERQFGSLRSPVYLDDIPLKGRIDRMDWIDPTAKLVRVIDYKTGKPKTEGQIRATIASVELSEREQSLPETIRGPLMRQLVFYKLLADLDPSFQGTVTHGKFLFVEPNQSQRTPFVEREFAITDQAVADLVQLIQEVIGEIRSLAFLL